MPKKKVHCCDGCNVNPPWEHRCHGENCECTQLSCLLAQGKISLEGAAKIASESVKRK